MITTRIEISNTAKIVSKYGVFSGPNAGKYGPKRAPYLKTFPAVLSVMEL